MIRRLTLLLVALFALGPSIVHAAPEPRLALVIGNGSYQKFDRLAGTQGDGDKIAAALSAVGFVDASGTGKVVPRRDLDRAAMIAAIAEFRAQLALAGPKAFGMLYFSGHGAALGSFGDVMLLPTDAGADIHTDANRLSRAALTKALLGSGAKTVLIVLDMCRNVVNAGPSQAVGSGDASAGDAFAPVPPGSKGLARIVRQSDLALRSDQGYLVAFSTSPDQFAFDDGTFSKVLAEEVRRPQQNIADALKRVSDRVALKPGKAFQKPTFDYGLQGAPPCFVSCDASAGDRFYDCANCPYMRVIPAGNGFVGSPQGETGRGSNESVQREISIAAPFAMGVYEVTVAEWMACVREAACRPISSWAKENPNPMIPATGIGFEDAQAYVAWLTVRSGLEYRLPTEEEWEYAARAGAGSAFPWGDDISPSSANYDQTANYRGSQTAPYRGYPEAVNAYPPNSFGLYQTSGNTWEWSAGCADARCTSRVIRGGSFQSAPVELRVANRFAVGSGKRRDDVGLRVVRNLMADERTQ